jgi:hypothetical protein
VFFEIVLLFLVFDQFELSRPLQKSRPLAETGDVRAIRRQRDAFGASRYVRVRPGEIGLRDTKGAHQEI